MSLTATTHLNFRGDARAALEFYQSVFGGQLAITTYDDVGMPKDTPGADSVVFGQVATADGFRILAYDIPGQSGTAQASGATRREDGVTITDQPFFVSVEGGSLEEGQGYWDDLASGATAIEPLAASAWSAGFGMLTDGFRGPLLIVAVVVGGVLLLSRNSERARAGAAAAGYPPPPYAPTAYPPATAPAAATTAAPAIT